MRIDKSYLIMFLAFSSENLRSG